MPKSDLPFGSEFSPSQIDLSRLLELAREYGGDWKAFEAAVYDEYFAGRDIDDYNRAKLANNTKLGMIAYGLVDRDAELTEVGEELFEIRKDEEELYSRFAHHILVNLYGTALIQTVDDMQAAGEKVTLVKLRRWLDERGIHFPRGGKHASIMRLWLEKAGVFVKGWRIDHHRVKAVLGTKLDEIDALATLSPEQKSFLRALSNTSDEGPHIASEVERLAIRTYGMRSLEKNLPKAVLYPLQDLGYIELIRRTEGRGAKSFEVQATDKLQTEIIEPLLDQLEGQADSELRPLLRKPLSEILEELESDNRHIRGLALEALAFKLMRLVGMKYVATRLRGPATGGAETDVIFESARLVFSRWQIQCKNTAQGVTLDDVAKEVGLVHMLKSNVIVMVSTGKISADARVYGNSIMRETNLSVVMVDRSDLEAITENAADIVDVLKREAANAMKLKELEID